LAWSKSKHREYMRTYVKNHRQRITVYKRNWYLAHSGTPEKSAWYRRYRKAFESWKNKREYKLFYSYGIHESDYSKMYKAQLGRCKICHRKYPKLVIDHCHKKKKVRGLLCQLCNKGIGMFYDNTIILKSAIKYLKEN